MPVAPSIITALRAALELNPDDQSLRLHLGSVLLEGGDATAALAECQSVLQAIPDSLEALLLAARAASSAGDSERAAGFSRLAVALGGATASKVESAPSPAAEPERLVAATDDAAVLPLRVVPDVSGEFDVDVPSVRLEDVGGMEAVKERLQVAFLSPMRNPKLREMFGKSLRGGLMLYGPPGCGKTFIARATAGELGAKFFGVGLSDVLDVYFGQSERNLHEIFETARRNSPCVLFFDEVDALGQKRTNVRQQAMWRGVIAQFLSEMDSISGDNEGIFVLAATNHPWDVDTALRRPGRFDRTVLVLPPDGTARLAIMKRNLEGRPVEAGLDLKPLLARTELFSGADLAHLCESAAEMALADSISSGTARPITRGDLEAALRDVHASTPAWFQVARNFAMFANEGGAYDDLLAYMRQHRLS